MGVFSNHASMPQKRTNAPHLRDLIDMESQGLMMMRLL